MPKVAESSETRVAKSLICEARQISSCLEDRQSTQASFQWGSPEYTAFYLGRTITLERLAGSVHNYIDTETKISLLQSLEMCRALLKVLPQAEGLMAAKRHKPPANISVKPTLLWRLAEGERFTDEFGRVFRHCGSFQKLLECPAEVPSAYRSEVGTRFQLSRSQRVFLV